MKADIMRYPIEVFWSDEDEGFIAITPDLPGASVWGKTETEAIKELHTVIGLWIKAAKKAGNPVPQRRDRGAVDPARGSDGQVALSFSVAGAGSKANPSRTAPCRRR